MFHSGLSHEKHSVSLTYSCIKKRPRGSIQTRRTAGFQPALPKCPHPAEIFRTFENNPAALNMSAKKNVPDTIYRIFSFCNLVIIG